MNNYAYQILGALEDRKSNFLGFRVVVCTADNFETVDIPAEVFDSETTKYLKFRLGLTKERINIKTLPIVIQNKIRTPMGRWLDFWVLENFYGHTSNGKRTNT